MYSHFVGLHSINNVAVLHYRTAGHCVILCVFVCYCVCACIVVVNYVTINVQEKVNKRNKLRYTHCKAFLKLCRTA